MMHQAISARTVVIVPDPCSRVCRMLAVSNDWRSAVPATSAIRAGTAPMIIGRLMANRISSSMLAASSRVPRSAKLPGGDLGGMALSCKILKGPGRSGRTGLAEEQVRGQDVERLELAPHVPEETIQIRQHARRELKHEERSAGGQCLAGIAQNRLANRLWHGAQGNPGDDVVSLGVTEFLHDIPYVRGRRFHHLEAFVDQCFAQEADELRVHLDCNQPRIGA